VRPANIRRRKAEDLARPSKKVVARWETRGGRYWFEVYEDGSFRSDGGGGSRRNADEAIKHVEKMVQDAQWYDRINYKRTM
jgi:hypothetical protein